nr:hypothetical protein [Tanacetum cinerariifolium]
MQAYNATSNESPIPLPRASIAPPTILPLSLVLPLSPMFDPQDFFLPNEIFPPRKQAHFLSLTYTDLSAQPQAFKIGENYHGTQDTSHIRHEEQIEDILIHLNGLSFDHIKEMEELDNSFWILPKPLRSKLVPEKLNKMPPKRRSTSAASASATPTMTQTAIRQLVADSVTVALETQAANMANTENTNRNTEKRKSCSKKRKLQRVHKLSTFLLQ